MTDGGPIASVYRERVLAEHRRTLGMLDRDVHSPTFGCMDRTFWCWKFTDFPGARFQEGLCTLAHLWATPFEGNPLHRSDTLLGWIRGGFEWWSRIQNRGGDFDEAYPGERSLAATAFTSFYLSEAYLTLDGALGAESGARFERSLHAAADWLTANDETHGFLSNHLAAAAAALLHASRILDEPRFHGRYRHFLDRILAHQSDEGWYEEYGGADPGYQTHGTFYLARCQQLTGDDALLDSLARSCEFLRHFVHPDGSLGGEYASRNTQTYYPAGFEMLASRVGAARWIADTMRPAVGSGSAAGLVSVDPYNYFVLMNNYVFAERAAAKPDDRAASDPPDAAPGVLHFERAGLIKVRQDRYDLYVAPSKGGVVKMFDRERRALAFSSCGYIGSRAGGKRCSSQSFDAGASAEVGERTIGLSAPFYDFARPVMTSPKFVLFRVFTLATGRFGAIAQWLKRLLVRVLIYRKSSLDLRLERRIELHDDGIELVDRIAGADLERLDTLEHRSVFTTIHMGSSRYFVPHELDLPDVLDAPVSAAGTRGPLEIRRRVRLGGGEG